MFNGLIAVHVCSMSNGCLLYLLISDFKAQEIEPGGITVLTDCRHDSQKNAYHSTVVCLSAKYTI